MKKLYRSLTKLPNQIREVITMKSNGKRKIEPKIITNRWLLVLENGNSVVLTEEQLKELGILVKTEVPEPVVVPEVDDDDDTIPAENTPVDDILGEGNSSEPAA